MASYNQSSLPPGWTEHKAPTGHTYYYNAGTKMSTYTRPQPPPAPVGLGPPSGGGGGPSGLPQRPQGLPPRPHGLGGVGSYPTGPGFIPGQAPGGFSRGGYPQVPAGYGYGRGRRGGGNFPPGQGGRGRGGFQRGGAHTSFQQRQHQHPQRKPDAPKTKREIPDAHPWVLVTTKKGNRFVHNLETKASLYTPPNDVMKAMEKMKFLTIDEERQLEKERVAKKKMERAATSQRAAPEAFEEDEDDGEDYADLGDSDAEGSRTPKRPADELEEDEWNEDDEYYDEDEEMDDEHDAKRLRTGAGGAVEFGEDDIAWQMQAMAEQFGLEQEDMEGDGGDDLTGEESVKLFKEMLKDLNINPYSTWEKEMPQMVDDGRYVLLPTTKKRQQVFQEWSRDRMVELKAEKEKQFKVDPRVPYLRFLEMNATPKLYWPEFKRKFRKEPEMKDVKVTDKDREKLYRDYIARMKSSIETRENDLKKLLKSTSGLDKVTTDTTLPTSISCDVRYIAVPKDRREEILADHVRDLPEAAGDTSTGQGSMTGEERRQRALREREEAVRREQRRLNYQVRQGKEMLRESEAEIQRAMDIDREGVLGHLQVHSKNDKDET